MGKEEFKTFVKKNPKLIKYVQDGSSSWQKFYEIYDIYGEDENAWKDYLGVAEVAATTTGIGDVVKIATAGFLTWLKSLDLDSIQNGVQSVQRVLSVLGDFGTKETKKEEYKPRPIYKHFED